MKRLVPASALILASACLLALGACGNDLESISQVSKFRVLGVQADPPEVNPGGDTAIRVLTADPEGDGRMIVAGGMAFAGLMTPSSTPDTTDLPPLFWFMDFAQANPNGVIEIANLAVPEYYLGPDGEPVDLLIPDDGDDENGEELDFMSVTALILMCAGDGFSAVEMAHAMQDLQAGGGSIDLEDPTALEGLCVNAGADEGLVAFKTFDISLETERPNANPAIDLLEMKRGASLENVVMEGTGTWFEVLPWVEGGNPGTFFCKGDECRDSASIRAFLTPESFQTYEKVVFGDVETRDERTYISWFTEGGEFNADRSGNDGTPGDPFEVEWLPPREGGEHLLWAVAHDIRGGVSWKRYMMDAVIGQGE